MSRVQREKGGGDWEVEAREGGIYLPQVDLWMDSKRPQKQAVVTHAHYDHLAGHREILASPGTARLLQVRLPKRTKIRAVSFGEPFSLGRGASFTLLPAGHILGSAMVLVKRRVGKRETQLLYTGDFKLRGGKTSEKCEPKRADVLVMETTFGRPEYRFPPEEKVVVEMIDFCRKGLREGKVPILLGYSLGKSQEILQRLGSAGFPILMDLAGHRMCEVYRELGQALPPAGRLGKVTEEKVRGHLLIVPPSMVGRKGLEMFDKFYHASSIKLSPNSIIEGGLHPLNMDKGVPFAFNNYNYIFIEMLLELVRLDKFNDKPKRSQNVFVCDTKNQLKLFLKQHRQNLDLYCYEVSPINKNFNYHVGDFNYHGLADKMTDNLIFKNIKLEALNKDILEGLKPKLAELDLVKNKFKEITKYQTITSGRAVTVIPSKEIVATEEFKNKITNAGMAVQEFIKNIDILREQGGMSVKDVEKSFNGLMYTIKTMAPDIATQALLMKEAFKGLDSDIAKAATAIKDVEKQTLLLEAAMYGAVIPVAMLNAYTQNTGSGLYSEGELKGDIERLIKFAKEVTDKKYKTAQDALRTGTQGEKLTYEKSYSIINNFFNTQEALIKQQRKSEADLLQTKIDNAQAAVDAAEKEIDAKQKIIDTTQREIDLLNRRIELEFDRPIQKLQDESTILNNNLEIIRRQEDAINNQYDKQIQALEKISSVNQEIANQEKSRLNIASALTSGDVAAAAQAVQEARAQAAASQIEKQRTAIEASRQQAISAVSVGGMTKDQIEARTYQISQQVFTLEQQRKTLQAEIVILQDKNYIVEQQIYDIKQKSVIPNQQIVDSTKLALDQYNKQTESLFNNLTYLGKTKTQWEETNTKIEAANATLATQELSLKKINTLVSEIQNKYAKMSSAPGINPFSTSTITPTTYGSAYGAFSELYRAKMYGGKILPMNMGGVVPKYFARGGRMGSDTVPAMLTPGEFVMNKKATKEFGPLLSMLNESKYPSMIGPSYSSEKVSPNKTSINNNSRNVYNYNVGINVGGTNASANNIAKAVMDEIKYLDAQRIRGQRAI